MNEEHLKNIAKELSHMNAKFNKLILMLSKSVKALESDKNDQEINIGSEGEVKPE